MSIGQTNTTPPHWFRGAVVLQDRVLRQGLVGVAGGRITGVWDLEAGPAPDHDPRLTVQIEEGDFLSPGFIDLHVHGGGGADFMDGDPEADGIITELHARHGTTGLLATTLTAPEAAIIRAIEAAARAPRRGARILGVHVEGPFINPKRKGAQDEPHIRLPSAAEAERWLSAGSAGFCWHVTLAPELPGAAEAIAFLTRRGAVVSAGHTDCTYDQLQAGVQAGVSHVTHLFNAMTALHHREPGAVGGALSLPGLTVELIGDGVHVHPAAMALAVRARGADAVVLVTDAMRATGMPEGEYFLGDQPAQVRNGEARLADGALAGSVLTMAGAVRNAVRWLGVPLHKAVALASLNPARIHRLDGRKGSIAPGKDADLVHMDRDFNVRATIVEGEIVYQRS